MWRGRSWAGTGAHSRRGGSGSSWTDPLAGIVLYHLPWYLCQDTLSQGRGSSLRREGDWLGAGEWDPLGQMSDWWGFRVACWMLVIFKGH